MMFKENMTENRSSMSFREFYNWCNDRACDGHWGIDEAYMSLLTLELLKHTPFFKREKLWKTEHEKFVLKNIVNPTEKKIIELCGKL